MDHKQVDIPLNDVGVGKSYFYLKPYLRGENYGVVAYAFRSPKVQCFPQPIQFNGLILRTNMGIYTQFHPTVGIIKLNRLTDGEPIPGVSIKIYREDDLPRLDKIWDLITNTLEKKVAPCLEGVTDVNGVLRLSAKEMAQCTKRKIRNKVLNELYPPEADPDDIMYGMIKRDLDLPSRRDCSSLRKREMTGRSCKPVQAVILLSGNSEFNPRGRRSAPFHRGQFSLSIIYIAPAIR